ncbi:hypothetical protein [Aquirhabdus sp.]|uniref:hypothetical protein n=1 Tax=Aquirhabdus sp. TaxID=2824160 RepID=UPI00396C9DA5
MKIIILAALCLLTFPALAAVPADPSNPLNYSADQSVPPVASHPQLSKNHPAKQAGKHAKAPRKDHKPYKAVKCHDGSHQHLRLSCAPHGGVARS